MKKLIIILLSIFWLNNLTIAQENQNGEKIMRESALKVFLDCQYCDREYIKREIPFVNYVRDRKEAQVHILITIRATGGKGWEFKMELIGLKEFEGDIEKINYSSNPNNTIDEIRQGYTNILKIGLMKFVGTTPLKNFISINYNYIENEKEEIVEDKWKSWVFRINMEGKIGGEESFKYKNLKSSFLAEKVTPEWRYEFKGKYENTLNKYKLQDDSEYESNRGNSSFEQTLIKSLGDHWSVGEFITLSSSTYMNNKFSFSVFPALEYNLFPYEESSRKQLRFIYGIGHEYFNYRDTTIYNKMQEVLFKQVFYINLGIKQPWGNIYLAMNGSSYLHNFSNSRLNFSGSVNWRIYKGLSFRVSGNYSIIHDQLSLPKQGATQEEILLRIRQIESQYNYKFEVGLSYTFGSIYNNVVNPRFGK